MRSTVSSKQSQLYHPTTMLDLIQIQERIDERKQQQAADQASYAVNITTARNEFDSLVKVLEALPPHPDIHVNAPSLQVTIKGVIFKIQPCISRIVYYINANSFTRTNFIDTLTETIINIQTEQ
jgi:hypothetical protein